MKLFEDLPSTNIPINAENLNQIKDKLIVVSKTEPSGDDREKVWMQKGKNLFNGILEIGILDNSTGLEVAHANGIRNRGYINVEPNTTYTISNNNNYAQYLYEYDENRNLIKYTSNTENNFTFTTTSTTKYLRFRTKISTVENDTTTLFQLEQGDVATSYEAYIKPTIYVKNNNDVYEAFINKEDCLDIYSTEEQAIGIWIDGRSIYKKTFVFDIGSHSNSIYHTITTMQNAEIINAYGIFKTNNAFRVIGGSTVENDGEITRIYGEADGRVVFYANAFTEVITVYATLEYVKTTD